MVVVFVLAVVHPAPHAVAVMRRAPVEILQDSLLQLRYVIHACGCGHAFCVLFCFVIIPCKPCPMGAHMNVEFLPSQLM